MHSCLPLLFIYGQDKTPFYAQFFLFVEVQRSISLSPFCGFSNSVRQKQGEWETHFFHEKESRGKDKKRTFSVSHSLSFLDEDVSFYPFTARVSLRKIRIRLLK